MGISKNPKQVFRSDLISDYHKISLFYDNLKVIEE